MKKTGPELSAGARRRLEILFAPPDWGEAEHLLVSDCGYCLSDREDPDRLRFAALKCSRGSLERLRAAVSLGNTDYRDLLMEAGFGWTLESYREWEPRRGSSAARAGFITALAALSPRLRADVKEQPQLNTDKHRCEVY